MKVYNDVGCIIDGLNEEEFEKFKNAGWMSEDDYFKLHPEDKEEEK